MPSTSPRPLDEACTSSDANGRPLSLGTHLDQTSILPRQHMASSQTLYIPTASPPTPAPSPGPLTDTYQGAPFPPLTMMNTQNSDIRRRFLYSVISSCTPAELLFMSQAISPILKRDFLYSLPTELSLHILKFIDEPKTLIYASQVSKHWRSIVRDESLWKRMCHVYGFDDDWDLESDVLSQQLKKRLRIKSKTSLAAGGNGEDRSQLNASK
jgi:F-box-like